ncbi:MAG TPA: hypothetical protein VGZ00_10230 [Candidatus Baltobacteraceae bacterium]|nr:hypothetical protein [Candidatus Baltobacteraceae bacterium]
MGIFSHPAGRRCLADLLEGRDLLRFAGKQAEEAVDAPGKPCRPENHPAIRQLIQFDLSPGLDAKMPEHVFPERDLPSGIYGERRLDSHALVIMQKCIAIP